MSRRNVELTLTVAALGGEVERLTRSRDRAERAVKTARRAYEASKSAAEVTSARLRDELDTLRAKADLVPQLEADLADAHKRLADREAQ